jgi:hypothetical protein
METLLFLLTNTTVVFSLKSYTNPLNKQQLNVACTFLDNVVELRVRPFNLQEGGMVIFPESDFFFLHQNQNIFFSNIGNQNIFF